MLESDLLTADVLPAHALAASDIAAWRAIAASNPALNSPFFSPEFTLAVAKSRDDVLVAAIRDRGLPFAYLPFQFEGPWQRRAGAAERVGAHLADHFGLIAPADIHVPSGALLALTELNAFTFSRLTAAQAEALDGERPKYGLSANLAGGWKTYWAGRTAAEKALAADIERSMRQLTDTHGMLRFCFDERGGEALPHLIAAKRRHVATTSAAGTLAPAWTRRLLEVLADTRAIHCAGVVSTLFAGDTWVASHFGLCSSRVLHSWLPVYNPDLARFSPDRLLLRAILEAAAARRIATVDFGAGDAPHARKFATTRYQVYGGAWYRPGIAALGYRVAQSLAGRFKTPAAHP